MLIRFFLMLRAAGVPVALTEFLALLEALAKGTVTFAGFDAKGTVPSATLAERFYWLSRAILVKDERHYDRFDRVFAAHFRGAEAAFEALLAAEVPADWLRQALALSLSDEDKSRIQALGGWDALMQALRERLAEQKSRHEGGSRWIGTGGTSPFGHSGYNPEGVRIGEKLLWFLNTSLKSAPQYSKFLPGSVPPQFAPGVYRTAPKPEAAGQGNGAAQPKGHAPVPSATQNVRHAGPNSSGR